MADLACVAHAWDIVTTGASSAISPVTAELADLVLWIGRLAYDNPRWTPAQGDASRLRGPADLAGSPGDVTAVLAAIHHAADATTRIALNDRDAVRQAAVGQRLYVPTRLLPETCDIPYRYGHAHSRHIAELLTAYDTATQATGQALSALDTVAVTLDSPSRVLAADRASQPAAGPASGEHRGTDDPITVPVPPPPRPERQQTGQALRALKISEPTLLARAAAIDQAADSLIEQATTRSRRRISVGNGAPQPADRPDEPARTAAKDLPPQPVTTAGRARHRHPNTPPPDAPSVPPEPVSHDEPAPQPGRPAARCPMPAALP